MSTIQAQQSPLQRHAPALPRVRWLGSAGGVIPLVALVGGLYGTILWDLVGQWWNDANYSHGFLVPFFSAFIIWQRRATLAALVPQGSWMGFLTILVGVSALILGDISAELFLMRSSLIVVIAGLVLFYLGPAGLRLLAFPIAFLLLMIPLPAIVFNAVAFPLQGLAVRNAVWTLDFLGVPVLRDGNVIHLSHISLGVTEACSGVRSLFSLLALAVAWAYLTLPGLWSRTVLIASTVPITIIANAGRVIITGLIGQWFGVEYTQGFFHTFSGWLIFLFAFIGLLGVQGLLRSLGVTRRPPPPRPHLAPALQRQQGPGGSMTGTARVVLACSLLLGTLLLLQCRSQTEAVPIRQPLDVFPTALGNWQGREATIFDGEILNLLQVKDYLMRRYVDRTGRSLWLYIAYWDTQRKGAQLHSPKNCLPGSGWEPVEATRVPISVGAPARVIEVNRYLIQKDQEQALVLYWYQSQGRVVANEVDAKLQLVKNAIFSNRTDGALIRISTPIYENVHESFGRLVQFAQAMYPHLELALPD